jgi:hypothetical protein
MVAILVQSYGIRTVSNCNSAAICLILACALTISAHATTIIVSNTNDNGPGSLRHALAVANDGDTIDATGISGEITLTSGELLVDRSVTINGAGADVLAADGNMISRVFRIPFSGETVTISGFTIRNGHAGTTGGGVDNENNATVTITSCTISGNTAGLGGGMFNGGLLTIDSTTISDNSGSNGGAIYNDGAGMSTLTNSTVSGNTASEGGGIFNIGEFAITNSTLSTNSASLGGGIFSNETVQIGDTVLNTGASGANIANFGIVTSLGYNLSSDDGGGVLTGPGDQVNTDPLLGPLQDNGGPTFTHALLSGSPAIDAGDPNFTPPPDYDQRGPGFPRVANGRVDVGSFEVQTQTVAIHLEASGRKVNGINTVRLNWSGATSTNIDVNRNGIVIATVPNTGTYTDSTGDTGRARYTYKVCEAGTQACSNNARVTFR